MVFEHIFMFIVIGLGFTYIAQDISERLSR